MFVRYIDSSSRRHQDTLLAWLLRELPLAEHLALATGYFDASILDWIEPELEALLTRGGEAHFAIGSNQGQTARADLERLFCILEPHRPRASLFVVHLPGGLFHPKAYFVSGPDRYAALVGSPNFTTASAVVNIESAVILEAETLEPPLDAIAASLTRVALGVLPNASEITSAADLRGLEALGAIGVPRAMTPRPVRPLTGRARRRRRRFPPVARVVGTPAPRARRRGEIAARPGRGTAAVPLPRRAGVMVVFAFSSNDLKQTGTREFSVPEAVRTWAARVLGAPIRVGQGDLLHTVILARLAAAPNTVFETPDPVRLWSAGGSGGTHQDVRLVLGSRLRSELEDLAVDVYGEGLTGGDMGVLELPPNPVTEPLRLTIFRPADPDFPTLDGMAVRTPPQQKPQAVVSGSLPALPPWPY